MSASTLTESLPYLKHNLWNPNSTILFVGYQAPGTLGYSIVNGAKTVKIFGEEIAVNARIEYIEGYSGHADQEWLMNFIYSYAIKPKHIFLVHGEAEGQIILKNKILEDLNIPVTIPEYGETYELKEKVSMTNRVEGPNEKKFVRLEILERMRTLKEEIEDMEEIVKDGYLSEDRKEEDITELAERLKELENQIVKIVEKS